MAFTTTAIGFLILAIGLAICGFIFLQVLRKPEVSTEDKQIGSLLSLSFLGFALQNGEMGLGLLFFAHNPTALYYVLLLNNIFLVGLDFLGIYTIYHIFFPQVSPRPALSLVAILGIAALAITILVHPEPQITKANNIDLNFNLSVSLSVFYLLFVGIGANAYIFIRLFLQSAIRKIKLLSLTLAILSVVGVINIFIRLIILRDTSTNISGRIFDAGITLIGLGFISALAILPALLRRFNNR